MIGSHAILLLITVPSLIYFMLILNFIKFTKADFEELLLGRLALLQPFNEI